MNRQQKRAIVAEARRLFAQVFPDANPASACLYLSWAVCQVARQHGQEAGHEIKIGGARGALGAGKRQIRGS